MATEGELANNIWFIRTSKCVLVQSGSVTQGTALGPASLSSNSCSITYQLGEAGQVT